MSKRGVALGGKYPGIYKKTMADRSIRYGVLIATTMGGRRRYKYVTMPPGTTLQQTIQHKKELEAKKVLGQLQFQPDNATLGLMVQTMNSILKRNKNYQNDCLHLKEIAWFFGKRSIQFHELSSVEVDLFFDDSTPLESIEEVRITDYLEFLNRQPLRDRRKGFLSNRSKDHRLKTLRHLLNVAHKKGLISYQPKIPFFRNYGKRPMNLTLEVFQEIFNSLPQAPKPHRAIILAGVFTGQRRRDVLRMRANQFSDGFLHFRSSKTGKRDFRIEAPKIFVQEVEKLMPFQTPWMFPNPKTNKPYSDLRKPIQTACQKFGLPHVTFHMIRHLTADLVAQISGKEMAVKEYLGWSSIEMVRRYTHIETWANQYVPALEQRVTSALKRDCVSEVA